MEKGQKLKTKVRFTSLDVAAIVQNLQALVGMRATNIYDLNPSTYLLKLAKSEDKHYLLIQNGVRFHTTQQKPDKKVIPSGFTMKFRKYLRSKRLQSIRQVGVERVVVFTFGSQSFTNHLILQLYAQGNIILTDNNYRILQCIRSHQFNEYVKTAVGEIYPFEYAANIYLENLQINQQKINAIMEKNQKEDEAENNEQQNKGKSKKDKKKGNVKVKDVVFKLLPCLFPLVIEHILLSNNKNPQDKVTKQNKNLVLQCGQICLNFLKTYLKSKHQGYLFQKQFTSILAKESKQPQPQKQYFQFSSYKNVKYTSQPCKQFKTFDQAVNQYFLKYKKTQHQQQQDFQGIAWKKYDQIKRDQDERVKKLQQQQDIYKVKAQYIQKNISDVDAIIKIIKTMQDNGYSWDDIKRMIHQSKKNGDPIANMIHDLNILKRQVTVLLGDPVSQQQMFELLPVEINIDYNAYTNATMYYENKKRNFQKEQRTKQASQQVLKLAEKDALKKIQKKKNQYFAKNLPQRKTFWFEKFNWFISSQGYLIISGRDSQQNELVVKRYMKTGDLYMHSDYGGAASTVIKRHRKDIPVPTATLEEAAAFTVCRSKAWQTKIISGAWWVYPQQVSKSAPTGQYLPTGSFMIRGKRNFIYPNRMQMVDNESAQRHQNDRRIHQEEMKKQEQQNKKVVPIQSEQKQQQEFAIVSIDTQTRKQKQQQMKKLKQNNINMKKQLLKPKEQQKVVQNQKEDSDQQNSDEEDDSQDGKGSSKLHLTKKASQQNKGAQKGVNNKKQQQTNQPPAQKHKQRNKKKLKKLQKYLQEQDEDQRQIIMKMLGAKEMKHMKQADQQESEQDKKADKGGKKKKDKKKTKKGINKYIDFDEDDEYQKDKLNPDKVLFLKDKKKQQQVQNKQLLENSESSDDEKGKVKGNKRQKGNNKDKMTEKQTKQEKKTQVQVKQKPKQQKHALEANTSLIDLVKPQLTATTETSQQKPLEQKIKQKQPEAELQIANQSQSKQQHAQQEQHSQQQQQEEQQQGEQIKQGQQQNKNTPVQEQEVDEKLLDSQLGELYKLVGNPHPEDKFEFFVPMCAPYSAINAYKFKIKLVPGGLKKGKAARNIIQYFQNSQLTEQQKGMLRGLPEQDMINAVIGNIKLAGAGLLKMEMKEKQQKKIIRKQQDKKKQAKQMQ